jgi:hypothetical protein
MDDGEEAVLWGVIHDDISPSLDRIVVLLCRFRMQMQITGNQKKKSESASSTDIHQDINGIFTVKTGKEEPGWMTMWTSLT